MRRSENAMFHVLAFGDRYHLYLFLMILFLATGCLGQKDPLEKAQDSMREARYGDAVRFYRQALSSHRDEESRRTAQSGLAQAKSLGHQAAWAAHLKAEGSGDVAAAFDSALDACRLSCPPEVKTKCEQLRTPARDANLAAATAAMNEKHYDVAAARLERASRLGVDQAMNDTLVKEQYRARRTYVYEAVKAVSEATRDAKRLDDTVGKLRSALTTVRALLDPTKHASQIAELDGYVGRADKLVGAATKIMVKVDSALHPFLDYPPERVLDNAARSALDGQLASFDEAILATEKDLLAEIDAATKGIAQAAGNMAGAAAGGGIGGSIAGAASEATIEAAVKGVSQSLLEPIKIVRKQVKAQARLLTVDVGVLASALAPPPPVQCSEGPADTEAAATDPLDLVELGRVDEAIAEARRGVEAEKSNGGPAYNSALQVLGLVLAEAESLDEAQATSDLLADKFGGSGPLNVLASTAGARCDFAAAASLQEQIRAMSPGLNDKGVEWSLAAYLVEQGQWEKGAQRHLHAESIPWPDQVPVSIRAQYDQRLERDTVMARLHAGQRLNEIDLAKAGEWSAARGRAIAWSEYVRSTGRGVLPAYGAMTSAILLGVGRGAPQEEVADLKERLAAVLRIHKVSGSPCLAVLPDPLSLELQANQLLLAAATPSDPAVIQGARQPGVAGAGPDRAAVTEEAPVAKDGEKAKSKQGAAKKKGKGKGKGKPKKGKATE